jgi:hypothetical protein
MIDWLLVTKRTVENITTVTTSSMIYEKMYRNEGVMRHPIVGNP